MSRWDGETSLLLLLVLLIGWGTRESWREDRAEQWRQVRIIVGKDPAQLDLAPGSPAGYMEAKRSWFQGVADAALADYRRVGGTATYDAYIEAAERAYKVAHWKPHMSDSELAAMEFEAAKDAMDRLKR